MGTSQLGLNRWVCCGCAGTKGLQEWCKQSGKETPSGVVGLEPREYEVGRAVATGIKGSPSNTGHDFAW